MIRLARHGQTAYNASRRFQGHLPVPLDDTGREQARALADACAPLGFRSLWCSPLARARETADVVGELLGLEPQEDPRWAETDCGDWTDRPWDDVIAEDPGGFARFAGFDLGFAFPGGESFAGHRARVEAAAADLRARSDGKPALVVCHAVTIRLVLVSVLGEDAARSLELPNTALVEL